MNFIDIFYKIECLLVQKTMIDIYDYSYINNNNTNNNNQNKITCIL